MVVDDDGEIGGPQKKGGIFIVRASFPPGLYLLQRLIVCLLQGLCFVHGCRALGQMHRRQVQKVLLLCR